MNLSKLQYFFLSFSPPRPVKHTTTAFLVKIFLPKYPSEGHFNACPLCERASVCLKPNNPPNLVRRPANVKVSPPCARGPAVQRRSSASQQLLQGRSQHRKMRAPAPRARQRGSPRRGGRQPDLGSGSGVCPAWPGIQRSPKPVRDTLSCPEMCKQIIAGALALCEEARV